MLPDDMSNTTEKQRGRLGRRVMTRLADLGKDQVWLAAVVDRLPSQVNRWCWAESANSKTIGLLARALDVPPSYFYVD